MKYFLDTEFVEDGRTIELISLALVAEDGRELYVEVSDAHLLGAGEWVKENVLPHLWHRQPDKSEFNRWTRDGGVGGLMLKRWVRGGVHSFCGLDENIQFYGYYADYDWVAFCQLFGTMMDLPKGFPMYCRDLKQMFDERVDGGAYNAEGLKAHPEYPKQETEHHALADARWNRDLYNFLDLMK